MTKLNILITGATGFIGHAFLARLDKEQHNVFVLARSKPADFLMSGIQDFYEQDLNVPFQLNIPFDYVFHLAACNFTNVGQATKQQYQAINVEGTKNLIDALRVKKFIFMSTARVYRFQGMPLVEESPLGPVGLYEQSKLEAEEICRKQIPRENLIILRSTNIVGPGQADKALIPIFFKNALNDKPLTISVSAKTPLQLLSVEDMIDIFLNIISFPSAGGIYNIAPLEIVTIKTVAREVISLTHSRSTIECVNFKPADDSPVKVDKAIRVFQWRPKTEVKELLRQCYQYYKRIYAV